MTLIVPVGIVEEIVPGLSPELGEAYDVRPLRIPLTTGKLFDYVYSRYIDAYPSAAEAVRENTTTGVPRHNPTEIFVWCICAGVVSGLANYDVRDLGSGTDDVPGTPKAVRITLPANAIRAAKLQFVERLGWVTPEATYLELIIDNVLLGVEELSVLVMDVNPRVGTGTGIVSLGSSPAVEQRLSRFLLQGMLDTFLSSGCFGEGDDPLGPVNAVLAGQLPEYAAAYARALSRMTATIDYTGVGGGAPVSRKHNYGHVC